ncbi:glycosyltransferase family 4 protein [Maritimibacter sp. DP1N21-5]|uniref:glycosyltransferase family 4 protein n=1 Tax=Maritimibacter sp. DP1N21-5 TaxID=2836867 RepID=UPI001C48E847|nr:glycosyltransferase family 4 protein [Maritimibacter sp. DP1N21-5]MBV7411096.1 glycosyltransferase family 4 protein [Maritimibacter sp. DP1N21-5]
MRPIRHFADRPHVAIVDPCSAAGYDLPDIEAGGLGGTEATVLRISAALGASFDITHFQHGRSVEQRSIAGRLCPLGDRGPTGDFDALVVINRWKVAVALRRRYPGTAVFLWLHVYPGRHNRKMGTALKEAGITVICVSLTHERYLETFLNAAAMPRSVVIYNPLNDALQPDGTPRDPCRLLFASSPHKGLAEVFAQFATLRAQVPDLTLAVADPGYLRWECGPVPEGVTFLGALSHPALMEHLRRALCLFYPQTTFAETFGLILAEANAVGTPVLVHGALGANAEIVADRNQHVDGHDPAQILARIQAWRRTAPRVRSNPAFRLSSVAQKWADLLSSAVAVQDHLEVQS